MASLETATRGRKTPPSDTLAGLVAAYRQSAQWRGLADSTRRQWVVWLDRLCADDGQLDLGGFSLAAFDDRRVREDILAWRDQWAATPRTADYAMQVLSRILAHGVELGRLAINAAEGVGQLWRNDRADLVWTDDDLALFALAAPSFEVAVIPALACLTGLRREDLATLAWTHVGEVAIVKPTGKSRGRRTATIPILKETAELLAEIGERQAARHAELAAIARRKRRPEPPAPLTVLSNTRGAPWTANGLEHQVVDAKAIAGIAKHLHDCRGTFATRLRLAGLTGPEIADIVGWEEGRVERLLARYVDRDVIVQRLAERIARNETGA